MESYLLAMLCCPSCHHELDWTIEERDGNHIDQAQAHCPQCNASYPVHEGIGLFLTPDLQRDDLWQQVDSQLSQYLDQHPAIAQRLLYAPAAELNPADLFFRAMVLEEQGAFDEARATEELANQALYTPEYSACWQSQYEWLLGQLRESTGPIVDLASGRGYLVEQIARTVDRPVVATDFSPLVLRQDRRRLEHLGVYQRVSLLAFDARRTPFREHAVTTLTTNLGLPNIAQPGDLLAELRRISAGMLLAISFFYPPEDKVNTTALQKAGASTLIQREATLAAFKAANWKVELANVCHGRALPTPTSQLIDGAQVDSFPINETTLEWTVLVAR